MIFLGLRLNFLGWKSGHELVLSFSSPFPQSWAEVPKESIIPELTKIDSLYHSQTWGKISGDPA